MGWRFLGRIELPTRAGDLAGRLGKKQIALLSYLSVQGKAVSREDVAALLWPSPDPARSRHNLRQAIAAIRKAAGDDLGTLLDADRDTVEIGQDIETDVGRLSLLEGETVPPETALDLCGGEFLPGLMTGSLAFDDWLKTARGDAWSRQLILLEAAERAGHHAVPRLSEALERTRRALAAGNRAAEGAQASPQSDDGARRSRSPARWLRPMWLSALGVLVGLGVAAVVLAFSPGLRSLAREVMLASSSPARISVRPFSTINDAPAERQLAGGVTIGVTYALYAITARELFVVTAPPSVIQDTELSVPQFAGLLDVRYLIEGTVEVDGPEVRVFVRCYDSESGHDIWQYRFTSTVRDAFTLQDEIVLRILQGLDIDLSSAERNRIQYLDDTESLDAWLLAADGVRNLIRLEPADLEAAYGSYRRALEIDPTYASARRGLAWYQLLKVRFGIAENVSVALTEARNHLNIVLRDRPDDGMSKALEGLALLLEEEWNAAVRSGIEATELLPGSADAWAVLAHTYTFTGQSRRALRAIDRAMSLSPGHPAFYDWIKGRAHRLLGEEKDAIEHLSPGAEESEALVQLVELTAAYASAGQFAEARKTADRIKALHPEFSATNWVLHPALEDPVEQSREFELLSQAGL